MTPSRRVKLCNILKVHERSPQSTAHLDGTSPIRQGMWAHVIMSKCVPSFTEPVRLLHHMQNTALAATTSSSQVRLSPPGADTRNHKWPAHTAVATG